MKQISTLCIVHQHPRILLGMKKKGFGMGKWNGFGGKVEKGESVEAAAIRELQEEVGIVPKKITKSGILDLHNFDPPIHFEMHIFKVTDFENEPVESDEMRPQWFHVNEWPFDESWPDDRHWAPFFLSDTEFQGYFRFGEDDTILEHNLSPLEK